ncbi:hypothetical protein CsNV_062 [Callinectes sapidus nudivirus]|nr:hypothetical protein CsNV_062 [Callinectes sapidus nudivirus]
MSKRKIVSQYASSSNNSNKNSKKRIMSDEEDDVEEIDPSKTDIAKVVKLGNSTEIGHLYTNALTGSSTVEQESILYIGLSKYTIVTSYNPIEIFNDYFISISNNVWGYVINEGFSANDMITNSHKVLTHMFLSILQYNNIIIPSNINIYQHDNNILMGECLYFKMMYEKNELNVHISMKMLSTFLMNEDQFDITLSSKINNEQCSVSNNFQKYSEDVAITEDLYKWLVSLFVLADHAATHYIEEYITENTDWIHHFNFGKSINSFILINTIYKISANITTLESTPKLIVDSNGNASSSEINNELDKIFDNTDPSLFTGLTLGLGLASVNSVNPIENLNS